MATTAQQNKRPRDLADNEARPAKRPHNVEADGAPDQPGHLLNAPLSGEHLEVSAVLPALQQLLQVYKVEYWALLEELRARHSAFRAVGRSSAANKHEEAQVLIKDEAVLQASKGSVRQLVQAALPDHQQEQEDSDVHHIPQQAVYGDERCGHGSLQEQPAPPALQAVEQLLLRLPADCSQGVATAEQMQQWHERFRSESGAVADLEQLASAATLQLMDAQGALACLCGTAGRWMIRRTAVSLGRSSDTKGDVDVDLSRATATLTTPGSARADGSTPAAAAAGDAGGGASAATAVDATGAGAAAVDSTAAGLSIKKVSRLQAQLFLELDGQWVIRNTGRAQLVVNGRKVARGDKVSLPQLSLLEVGGEPLLFMVNGLAVQRATARSTHLVM